VCGPERVREIFHGVFARFASSREFAVSQWAREPVLLRGVADVAGSFTLDDVREAVDSDFLEAGLGVSGGGGGGWKMAAVSEPRGPSYQEAKLRYVDVVEGMARGTVVFNSAGAHIPKLAAVCVAALDTFGLPNCLNLYLSGSGLKTSAPPHTDKQDVFVLQTAGSKHWRVFSPPAPRNKPMADPLARGKGEDILALNEMGAPLLEARLNPGDVLYVPAGYPHTTHTEPLSDGYYHVAAAGGDGFAAVAGDDPATLEGDGFAVAGSDGPTAARGAAAAGGQRFAAAQSAALSAADSVHMTLGVDTHIWGLSILGALQGALARANLAAMPTPTALPPETYWELMRVPRSLGFLSQHILESKEARVGIGPALTAQELAAACVLAEPARWEGMSEGEIGERIGAEAVHGRLEEHREKLVQIQRVLYEEAMADDGVSPVPGMPRVTLMRVKPHMDRIEQAMEQHVSWYRNGRAAKVAPAARDVAKAGFGGAPRKAAVGGKGKAGAKRSKKR
jgi:hypothetical protein